VTAGQLSLDTMIVLPNKVIARALECCAEVYPDPNDFIVDRSQDGYVILAIEGTNEMTDWATNLRFLVMSDDTHRGFKTNAMRTLTELVVNFEALDKEKTLVIAGHSLGGATATVVADLVLPHNPNIALVTAGSPRPGGRGLRARLRDNLTHYRFVHGDDIVPTTPPTFAGYVHTHDPIRLEDEDDKWFDGVEDHNIHYYVKAFKKTLP
jgi:pimeloyl-ACP methyl ester carboxylesterase